MGSSLRLAVVVQHQNTHVYVSGEVVDFLSGNAEFR